MFLVVCNYELISAGFQPVSLLPPSLSDYTSWSQTLPVRGRHSKRHSEPFNNTSSIRASPIEYEPESLQQPVMVRKTNSNPTNTKFIPRASMNYAVSKTAAGTVSKSANTDHGKTEATRGNGSNGTSATPSTTSGVPSSNGSSGYMISSSSSEHLAGAYRGKSPGEIVTSIIRKRKPTGGLKKAINLYQENRHQSLANEDRRGSTQLRVDRESSDAPSVSGDILDRSSTSAGK